MKHQDRKEFPVEIWGGVECSVVRIEDTVHDQLNMNGHEDRISDLEMFADIGISKIRYPLLWEKYVNQKDTFFKIHDPRLEKLRELNIDPIAGLLHHGSGPMDTSMMKNDFAERLADFAYIIAQRYPWIEFYTPVNEPLTTARFSGLYGIWYPHKKDDYSFLRMFLNQLKAIVLSIKRIKEINPNAKLIQTEDIAKIHSTKILKYQAKLENERTWLTYDILTGKFNSDHSLWKYFLEIGITKKELEFFIDNPNQPDICGFNYYVTSERFLDDRIIEYPTSSIGGNDFHDYADIEVVRVGKEKLTGLESLLKEASERYNLPIALTEIHLACTREEQMRWFDEAYKTATNLNNAGYDIRAVTAWSLLGSFDWNTLLQLKGEYYETGVFDIRSGKPRATAMAALIKSYTQNKTEVSQFVRIPGWWKRNVRIEYHIPENLNKLITSEFETYKGIKPLMVFGNGPMAMAIEQLCILRGLPVHMVDKSTHDFPDEYHIIELIQVHKPWAIINASGFTKIDEAELSPFDCFKKNTLYPRQIARICLMHNIRMLTFSTDQVFNGKKRQPYLEIDKTDPLNVFGMSKKIAEDSILSINPNVLIIRNGLLINPFSSDDFLFEVVFDKQKKMHKYAISDIIVSPAYLPDLINTSLDLLIDNEKGIWHISGPQAISYYDFAKLAAGIAGITDNHIKSIPAIKLASKALRPSYSVLKSVSGIVLPRLDVSISNYLLDAEKHFRA
jgi:dTDP-4-dehydrorhamnose reductase